MTYLGENLKTLRATKGKHFTQEVVAAALECKRSNLSAWENGVSEPSADLLVKLSKYYGVSIDRLLRQDMTKLSPSRLREVAARIDERVMKDAMQL